MLSFDPPPPGTVARQKIGVWLAKTNAKVDADMPTLPTQPSVIARLRAARPKQSSRCIHVILDCFAFGSQ